jgi:ubiquitin carboxyl-terminal hydrolase MINDY-3/4
MYRCITPTRTAWGLTQQHGGPCGVLASIQAELLRLLLFGPRIVHPISMITLDYPTTLPDNDYAVEGGTPDMSSTKMRQALALSMGIILARAAVAPSATLQDDAAASAAGRRRHAMTCKAATEQASSSPSTNNTPKTVKLVLPRAELWDTSTCLEWQHLEPWYSSSGGVVESEHLLTYSISLPASPPKVDHSMNDGWSSSVKRQKRIHGSDDGDSASNDSSDDGNGDDGTGNFFQRTELAHATAQFLLETHSLQWFQRPGGVLLMVMSLALSRGIPNVEGDMDDPISKLTSNFGHCSQELINLLLTGQAGKLLGNEWQLELLVFVGLEILHSSFACLFFVLLQCRMSSTTPYDRRES